MGRDVFFEMLHIFIIFFERFKEFLLKKKKKKRSHISICPACVCFNMLKRSGKTEYSYNEVECSVSRRGQKALNLAIGALWFLELTWDGDTLFFSTGFVQRTIARITLQQAGLTFTSF